MLLFFFFFCFSPLYYHHLSKLVFVIVLIPLHAVTLLTWVIEPVPLFTPHKFEVEKFSGD